MPFHRDPRTPLRGRREECAVLDDHVTAGRAGVSQTVVLRGEAGIGKTALLDYVAAQCNDCQVLRAAAVESEMELPFAALHQLTQSLLGGLERLPDPQRVALETAYGLSSGPPPDRCLVGVALLSQFSELAETRPLVCLVDDVQWMDRSSAQSALVRGAAPSCRVGGHRPRRARRGGLECVRRSA